MSTVQPDGDPIRDQLLDAAAAVFARQGFEGTKIMDIVREAGLSTGVIYGRFRSKEDLLRQAVIRSFSRGERASVDRSTRVADIVAYAMRHIDGELSDPEAVRLEAFVTARREPEVAAAVAEADAYWRDAVAPLVATAKTDGTLEDGVDADAVLFFVRTMHLGLLLHRGSGLPGPDPGTWRSLVDRLVASFGGER